MLNKYHFDRVSAGVIVLCVVLYLLISFSSWNEPIMGDEVCFFIAAREVSDGSMRGSSYGLWHPPLYVHLLALLEKTVGLDAFTARIPGLVFFVVSLVLIYLLCLQLCRDLPFRRQVGWAACALYALNPFSVRGSLLVDIDGTVLNVLLLAMMVAFSRRPAQGMGLRARIGFSVFCAVVLWAKFPGPLLFFGAMVLYSLVRREFIQARVWASIFAGGVVLFLLSWYGYCLVFERDFAAVFNSPNVAIKSLLSSEGRVLARLGFLRNIGAPIIWISPSLVAMAILAFAKISRQKDVSGMFFSLSHLVSYGLCVALAYIFIGGVTHSFPKYHLAVMPALVIAAAYYWVGAFRGARVPAVSMGVVFAVLVIFYIAAVQDPLYTVNYALREDLILREGRSTVKILVREAVQVCLIVVPVALGWGWWRRRRAPGPLLLSLGVTALAWNAALSVVQARAPYHTVYCYGATGVREAAAFILAHTGPARPIFGAPEFVELADGSRVSYTLSNPHSSLYRGPAEFIEGLREGRIPCVAYGIASNTVAQYRKIFNDPRVREFLRQEYVRHDFGSSTVWLIKQEAGP